MSTPKFITLTIAKNGHAGRRRRIQANAIIGYEGDAGKGAWVETVNEHGEDAFQVAETPEEIDALLGGQQPQPGVIPCVEFDAALNEAGWAFIMAYQDTSGGERFPLFNSTKALLKVAIETWLKNGGKAAGQPDTDGGTQFVSAPQPQPDALVEALEAEAATCGRQAAGFASSHKRGLTGSDRDFALEMEARCEAAAEAYRLSAGRLRAALAKARAATTQDPAAGDLFFPILDDEEPSGVNSIADLDTNGPGSVTVFRRFRALPDSFAGTNHADETRVFATAAEAEAFAATRKES